MPRQQNSTKRWSVWSTANTYIPLYRCNLHFGLLAARGCRRIPRKFPTIQSNRERARKSTPSLENANCSGCFLIFWDDICTYDFSTRDASCLFLYLSSASQDRKSAGDVMGHKCAGLVYRVCPFQVKTQVKYIPILWKLTTCNATTAKTPTSKRPPIHHQKYHSNATATSEN